MKEPVTTDTRCRRYAWALGALTALFAVRVAGQALQRWAPVGALPAFDDFQGSSLPYWLLLSVQIFLLACMVSIASDVAAGTRRRNARAARVLLWVGGLYMAGSTARILLGVVLPDPHAWFTAWIPAFFHVILAAYVLTLAAYHATAWRHGAYPDPA